MPLYSLEIGKRQEIRSAFKNGETFYFRSYKSTQERPRTSENVVFSLSTMIEISRIFQSVMNDVLRNPDINTWSTSSSVTCHDFTYGDLYRDSPEINTPASRKELEEDEFMDWADDQIVAVNFEDVFFNFYLPNPNDAPSGMGYYGPVGYKLNFGQLVAEEGDTLTEKAIALATRLYDAIVTDCKKESS